MNLLACPARLPLQATLAAALFLAMACSDDTAPTADAGPPDAATPDLAFPDLTFPDFTYPDVTPDMHPAGATWSAVKYADDLIATRGTVTKLPGQDTWDRFVGAAITLDGKRLAVYSVHPKCCGHIGHTFDSYRTVQMKSLATAIMKLRAGTLGASFNPWQAAPMVVTGDWNLVGSREPLDVMLNRTGGPGLLHLMLRHLKGSDVFTWYNDKYQTFPPGMLDLLVHSPDLKPRGGHVFDTGDLDSAMVTKLGLQAGDSAGSDHLLLVADLALL